MIIPVPAWSAISTLHLPAVSLTNQTLEVTPASSFAVVSLKPTLKLCHQESVGENLVYHLHPCLAYNHQPAHLPGFTLTNQTLEVSPAATFFTVVTLNRLMLRYQVSISSSIDRLVSPGEIASAASRLDDYKHRSLPAMPHR